MIKNEKIILIDADVVSHFIEAGEILLLPKIFPFRIFILNNVIKELERWKNHKIEVDNLINLKLLTPMNFPETNFEVKKEYLRLKKELFKGDGESACLAVARFNKNILASNNLRDIKPYCQMHNITYLTTMHFLCYARMKGVFDEVRCNQFIQKVRQKNGKLPVNEMSKYDCPEIWQF